MSRHELGEHSSNGSSELERIVSEAVATLGVRAAYIGLIGEGDERLVAARGWTATAIPRSASFAIRLRQVTDVLVVSDTAADEGFAGHPLVAGTPQIRFYAGAPIRDGDGRFLGALSLIDRAPRVLSPEAVALVRALGRCAESELRRQRDEAQTAGRLADAEALLEDANDRFRDFFEQTSDLVMSIGADGRLMHANGAVMEALGCTREELTSEPLLRVIDPESRAEFRRAFSAAMETGQPERLETVIVTSGGRRITVEGTLQPKVIAGRGALARVIFRDVTDRIQFEADLGSARDAALEAARLKTQFLTNVSHEIRTPMNGIVGMIDLLLSTPLQPEQLDFAHQARSGAEQLLSIVNNILYVSALEAGGLATANVDFDLYRTLSRIVEVMKVAALGKDIDVSFSYDEALPPIFRGNQARIRHVCSNLLENAVKFTEEGRISLSVSLQTDTDTHRVVRFEVRDTGIGIEDEHRLLLFERFSQIEAGSTRRFGGVGLGLATARQLVETMGGLIDGESTPGHGSLFWFTIPFPKQGALRRPVASSDLEFRGKRVLLVDETPTSRKVVRHYLETWEMRVETAENAAGTLMALHRAAESGDPVRVLLFDGLRDRDPLSFVEQIHASKRHFGTSLIYLATTHERVNQEAFRNAGIHASVAKPVGQGELFDALTIAFAHDALPLARDASQPSDSRALPPAVDPQKRKTIRVLLAEDNFLNRKLTMSQLEKLGYQADSVGNGKEAIEAVASGAYSVILMDCQMPIIDGYQATMEIRKLEQHGKPRHRIIAMTANALEGDREKCLAAGMDDYLAKPTKHEDLEIALARYFITVGE